MIDTHAHIDDEQYADDLPAFIAAQREGGVEAILVPSVNEASLETVPALCKRFPDYCYPAIGVHPEEIRDDYCQVLDRMEKALPAEQWIAVGEIGLDYHFDITYKAEQQAALRRQLEWALSMNLPVMIHSRDATEDCLRILKEYTAQGLQGVMHCFSGSNETARQIVDMGLYLGIGGVITFKNCKLTDNLTGIPLERILTETDAPYMAPVPYRGKRNEPQWMQFVVERLAQVYQLPAQEIDRVTTQNAKKLFRLK